ncbi:hypothetical protein Tco_1010086, partial [Tanacetum coccineum]
WYGGKGFLCSKGGESGTGVKENKSAVMNDLAKGNNNVSDTFGDSPIASKSLEHNLGTSHVLDDGANGKLNEDGVDSGIHINSGSTFLGPTSYDKLVTRNQV